MTYSDESEMCIACAAYLAHYPVMVGDHECEHSADETAFMLAMADAVHGASPEGEWVDAGWRAAQFLDEADLACNLGPAPYRVAPAPDALARGFSFLALVNGDYLIGAEMRHGDAEDLSLLVRLGGWLAPESHVAEADHGYLDATYCDGEHYCQIRMDVYGGPSVSIAEMDWLHASSDEDCACGCRDEENDSPESDVAEEADRG